MNLRHRKGGMFVVTNNHGRLVWRGKGWEALDTFAKRCDLAGPQGILGGCECCTSQNTPSSVPGKGGG